MKEHQPKIAIIGSGPSGCFTAQFLRKKWEDADITIFEALPTPFGLVRYGIAADHQGMKTVTTQFERLFLRNKVRFAGNVEVGKDIDFSVIKNNFDVVVRATGLRHDRVLSLSDSDSLPTIGAGMLLKTLNGHPDTDLPKLADGSLAPLGSDLAVIGNGNVAMDVIRILSKANCDFQGSDIVDEHLNALCADEIKNIHVLGRSSLCNAKFDIAMLKEILSTQSVKFHVFGVDPEDQCEAALIFKNKLQESDEQIPRINIYFYFGITPKNLKNNGIFKELILDSHDGCKQITVTNIISAIGFTNEQPGQECYDDNWTGDNVFKVGWLNCNGKGAVAENRKDAKQVSESIISYLETVDISSEPKLGYEAVQLYIKNPVVTFEDWQRIDRYELENARIGRCRMKITSKNLMMSIAHKLNAFSYNETVDA